jgi:hypothetical protein
MQFPIVSRIVRTFRHTVRIKHTEQERHIAHAKRGSALVTLKSAIGHDPELLFTFTIINL